MDDDVVYICVPANLLLGFLIICLSLAVSGFIMGILVG